MVHAILLMFSKEYKTSLIQNRQTLVRFLPNKTGKSEGMRVADIRGSVKSVYRYFATYVLVTGESIQRRSVVDERERMVRNRCLSMREVLDLMDPSYTTRFGT